MIEIAWDILKSTVSWVRRKVFGQKLVLASNEVQRRVDRDSTDGQKYEYYAIAIAANRRKPVRMVSAYCTRMTVLTDGDLPPDEHPPSSKFRLSWEMDGKAETIDLLDNDAHHVDVFRASMDGLYIELCSHTSTRTARRFTRGIYKFELVVTSELAREIRVVLTADMTKKRKRPNAWLSLDEEFCL